MSRITDPVEIRQAVLDAFKRPTGPVIVGRGKGFAKNLRAQLVLPGIHQSNVCRMVNLLIQEGDLKSEPMTIWTVGSGPDPTSHAAVHIYLS